MTDYNTDGDRGAGCLPAIIGYVIALIICALITELTGCTRPEIVKVVEITDTLIVESHDTTERIIRERETIITRDSTHTKVVVAANGIDTLRIYETHYIFSDRERATIDSLRQALDKSKAEAKAQKAEETIIKEVKRPLRRWQKFLIAAGASALVAVLLKILYLLFTRARAKEYIKNLINHERK